MHPETIVDFCRFLRDNGFHAGVLDTLSAVQTARTIEFGGIVVLQHGLRATLCASKEEWDTFDDLFETFLAGAPKPKPRAKEASLRTPAFLNLNGAAGSSGNEVERDGRAVSGASMVERFSKTDLSNIKPADQAALERVAQRLFQQAASRLSRRLSITGTRTSLDLRRTIHRNIRYGGEMFDLRYKGRKPKKPSLVILLDVSGSMNPYSLFLLRFAHALQRQFRRAHTFLFSTRLIEVTAELRSRDIAETLKILPRTGVNWSGGTKIGESLALFNAAYARKLLSRDTFFLILSDGWDTGEPERLASELRLIRERVRNLIWLNPLLGLDEYQPVTRAMAAALPHLDVFAPAHSLESLSRLDRYLCSTNS